MTPSGHRSTHHEQRTDTDVRPRTDPARRRLKRIMYTDPVPATAADTEWWRNPLVREITVVVAVKLALIFGLWWAFFDLPDEQRVGEAQVGAHVAGTPATRIPEETPK